MTRVAWTSDKAFRVDDTEFIHSFGGGSTSSRFCIQKPRSLVSLYERLFADEQGGRIVELGIAGGGSTALIALLANPSKLIACELKSDRVTALDDFVARYGLSDRVRAFYGIDQGDRQTLAGIIDAEFDGPLDVVFDDASHIWDKTCASFEVLYPRLRPGGLYIVEDWAGQYLLADFITAARTDPSKLAAMREQYDSAVRAGAKPRAPLAQLGAQLMLASVASPQAVEQMSVDRHWITVTRGPAQLDNGFRVADLYTDYFDWFSEPTFENWWYQRIWNRA